MLMQVSPGAVSVDIVTVLLGCTWAATRSLERRQGGRCWQVHAWNVPCHYTLDLSAPRPLCACPRGQASTPAVRLLPYVPQQLHEFRSAAGDPDLAAS